MLSRQFYRPLVFALTIYFFNDSLYSQFVTTNAELTTAINNATPGSEIILQNGPWTDVVIDLNVNGTFSNPIIIRAETPSQVHLTEDSRISIGGQYVFIEGFTFTDGVPTQEFVIQFRAENGDHCHNCKMLNITFDNYNSSGENNLKWVRLYGTHNEVSHSSFLRKSSIGSCILVFRIDDDTAPPDYHSIHHNYFAERTPQNGLFNSQNDQDAIRIGNSQSSLTDSHCVVFDNYFHNWEGEIEIISNKSGKNKYYNNTFDNYSGTLTLRHGNNCDVFNNFFFAKNNFKSGGIRIVGENHRVFNNYVQRTKINSSQAAGAIVVSNGRPNTALNGYAQVKNTLIAFNTIVDAEKGIRIGTMVKPDLSLPPSTLTIANNIMLDCGAAIELLTMPINNSLIHANMRQGGNWDIASDNDNSIVTQDLINDNSQDYRRLTNESPAIDASSGSYPILRRDITGTTRPSIDILKDRGAQEFGTLGTHRPYMISDVGVLIGAGSGKFIQCESINLDLYHSRLDNDNYQSLGPVWSTSIINNTSEVVFKSTYSITLDYDFTIEEGALFQAQFDDCTN